MCVIGLSVSPNFIMYFYSSYPLLLGMKGFNVFYFYICYATLVSEKLVFFCLYQVFALGHKEVPVQKTVYFCLNCYDSTEEYN